MWFNYIVIVRECKCVCMCVCALCTVSRTFRMTNPISTLYFRFGLSGVTRYILQKWTKEKNNNKTRKQKQIWRNTILYLLVVYTVHTYIAIINHLMPDHITNRFGWFQNQFKNTHQPPKLKPKIHTKRNKLTNRIQIIIWQSNDQNWRKIKFLIFLFRFLEIFRIDWDYYFLFFFTPKMVNNFVANAHMFRWNLSCVETFQLTATN